MGDSAKRDRKDSQIKTDDSKVPATKIKKSDSGATASCNWTIPAVVAVRLEVLEWAVRNIVRLLEEGCTIPFIARYRKEQTGGMEVQKLRDVCHLIEELK